MENKIRLIRGDIERYQQAIRDAEGALAAAEAELDALLAEEIGAEGGPFPAPDNIVEITRTGGNKGPESGKQG